MTHPSVPDIYAAIKNDLHNALPLLDPASQPDDYGRATIPATEQLLENLIKNYEFRLLDNIGDIHAFGNDVNDELVFSRLYGRNRLTN
ncbi:hypothetical protein [Cyclobacterium sp.]|uniref:hypothetical protein n=1 Tax=Cyclobacterium sp. TaxID=1966343 RepID=UPI00198AB751|nr:hypothetical protein [Cyclobacterium sp.]MBD3626920.1 hypothetical protein [Cyclobacterium sp.]